MPTKNTVAAIEEIQNQHPNARDRYQETLSQKQNFLNPAKMYTNDFYDGLGQSQLTIQGEQIISMY